MDLKTCSDSEKVSYSVSCYAVGLGPAPPKPVDVNDDDDDDDDDDDHPADEGWLEDADADVAGGSGGARAGP